MSKVTISKSVAGTAPGQRSLNGPQTPGRDYRNLSQPQYQIRSENNVAVTVRDGTEIDGRRPPTRTPTADSRR